MEKLKRIITAACAVVLICSSLVGCSEEAAIDRTNPVISVITTSYSVEPAELERWKTQGGNEYIKEINEEYRKINK